MNEELKRCPWCGKQPTLDKIEGKTLYQYGCCESPPQWAPNSVSACLDWNAHIAKSTAKSGDPKAINGEKKAPLHLIPPAANAEMAKALACGAAKYGIRNWLLGDGVNMTTYIAAMKRHIDCIIDGEDIDPESGAHHLGHVMAGCAIVLDAQRHGKLIDDRVLPPAAK